MKALPYVLGVLALLALVVGVYVVSGRAVAGSPRASRLAKLLSARPPAQPAHAPPPPAPERIVPESFTLGPATYTLNLE